MDDTRLGKESWPDPLPDAGTRQAVDAGRGETGSSEASGDGREGAYWR